MRASETEQERTGARSTADSELIHLDGRELRGGESIVVKGSGPTNTEQKRALQSGQRGRKHGQRQRGRVHSRRPLNRHADLGDSKERGSSTEGQRPGAAGAIADAAATGAAAAALARATAPVARTALPIVPPIAAAPPPTVPRGCDGCDAACDARRSRSRSRCLALLLRFFSGINQQNGLGAFTQEKGHKLDFFRTRLKSLRGSGPAQRAAGRTQNRQTF